MVGSSRMALVVWASVGDLRDLVMKFAQCIIKNELYRILHRRTTGRRSVMLAHSVKQKVFIRRKTQKNCVVVMVSCALYEIYSKMKMATGIVLAVVVVKWPILREPGLEPVMVEDIGVFLDMVVSMDGRVTTMVGLKDVAMDVG